MSVKAFTPLIAPATNLNTCVQVAVTDTSSATRLNCRQVDIKCLTQPVYIRLGISSATVTTANGYYMAVGDTVRWQVSGKADHILAIRATGSSGVISILKGSSD